MNNMIVCKKCGRSKDATSYAWRNKAKKKRQSTCKTCCRKELAKRKRLCREYVYDHLVQNPCAQCKERNPALLEFDHLNGKKFNISSGARKGVCLNTLKAEIKRCQVLCVRCHRLKTAEDQGWYALKRWRMESDTNS